MSSRTIMNKHNHHRGPLSHKQIAAASKRGKMSLVQISRKQRSKTISKAIKARQTKHYAICEGDILHPEPNHPLNSFKSWDVVELFWWCDDFKSTLATPSRDYIDNRTPAQKGKAIEMVDEAIHLLVNGHQACYRTQHLSAWRTKNE